MKKTLPLAIVLLLAAILIAGTASAAAPAPATDPEGVIRAIFTALNAGDVKAATANVADDGVLVLMPPEIAAPDPNVINGKQAITDWWTFIVSDKGGFDISNVKVDGNKVTWDAAMTGKFFSDLGLDPLQAEGVGIVQDGKLRSYVWNMSNESMARLGAALALAANKEVAQNWIKAVEAGDAKAMDALLAKDFVNRSPGMPSDREGFMGVWVANKEIFPTGKYTIDHIFAAGDLVSLYGSYVATHTGVPFEGIKASGAKINLPFAVLLRVKDGQITDRWAFSDDVNGLLVPLGFKVVPPAQ